MALSALLRSTVIKCTTRAPPWWHMWPFGLATLASLHGPFAPHSTALSPRNRSNASAPKWVVSCAPWAPPEANHRDAADSPEQLCISMENRGLHTPLGVTPMGAGRRPSPLLLAAGALANLVRHRRRRRRRRTRLPNPCSPCSPCPPCPPGAAPVLAGLRCRHAAAVYSAQVTLQQQHLTRHRRSRACRRR